MAAPPSISSLPASLKPLQHYLKTAIEHDKRDPVIAYYCRFYAMQRGMELDKSSANAKTFLFGMMDYMEKAKIELKTEEAIQNEVIGQAHVENYALKMFLYADTEDRAGRFNKNVVKSFYTAGMLFDVLGTFDGITEEIEKNRKYAKWKASYIHKCLKNGETPMAGPMPSEDDENAISGIGFDNVSGPSMPPPTNMNLPPDSGLFPTAGAHAPPSTPQEPPRNDYQPPPNVLPQQPSPKPVPRAAPAPQAQPINQLDWTPPANPNGIQLTPEQYHKGIKYCKFASSALQYEDSSTAIENLQKALRLLTTGRDSK